MHLIMKFCLNFILKNKSSKLGIFFLNVYKERKYAQWLLESKVLLN